MTSIHGLAYAGIGAAVALVSTFLLLKAGAGNMKLFIPIGIILFLIGIVKLLLSKKETPTHKPVHSHHAPHKANHHSTSSHASNHSRGAVSHKTPHPYANLNKIEHAIAVQLQKEQQKAQEQQIVSCPTCHHRQNRAEKKCLHCGNPV